MTSPAQQEPPGVGEPAPDMELPDQHGAPVSLRTLVSRRRVALVFFPHAHTTTCTSELRQLRDALPELAARSADLVAVCCDSMFTLRVFGENEHLGFPLLSDFWPHGTAAMAYGVFDADRGCALRGTFVVDLADGTEPRVRWRMINQISDHRSVSDLLAGLDATSTAHARQV